MEKKTFLWLKERVGVHDITSSFNMQVRHRVKTLESKYNWSRDEERSDFGSWQILLWKRVVFKRKVRVVGFMIRRREARLIIEFSIVANLREWLMRHGRAHCPVCGKLNWATAGNGACTTCTLDYSCQVCGQTTDHRLRPGDLKALSFIGLNTWKATCPTCTEQAKRRYAEVGAQITFNDPMREDLWVRNNLGRWKVKITARTLEGERRSYLYSYTTQPSVNEMKHLTHDLGYNFVHFDVDVKDLGFLN